MKNAILIASFGTTSEAALKHDILPLEQETARAFPGWRVHRAFTSQVVIRRLEKQGIAVDSLELALGRLTQEGYKRVMIMPTLLSDGGEYQKICTIAAAYRPQFAQLNITKPLLADEDDIQQVAAFIRKATPLRKQEALLLMGHGSAGSDNRSLLALAETFRTMDCGIFLAALIGEPDFSRTLTEICQQGYSAVCLAPLMLTAGAHAVRHLAGPEASSWQTRCRAAGLETTCLLKGLGAYPEIRALYLQHLSASESQK